MTNVLLVRRTPGLISPAGAVDAMESDTTPPARAPEYRGPMTAGDLTVGDTFAVGDARATVEWLYAGSLIVTMRYRDPDTGRPGVAQLRAGDPVVLT